jgi:mannose-6-phosphate isomerase-like protein (cupin superfamily)
LIGAQVARLISQPTVIPAAGMPPKIIEEFFGRVNSQTSNISIAKMTSPSGWREPGQTPEFAEYTVVLRGELQVETRSETFKVAVGQGIVVEAGEWVRYSTPGSEGAEYLAICLPAFSPSTVHRDE